MAAMPLDRKGRQSFSHIKKKNKNQTKQHTCDVSDSIWRCRKLTSIFYAAKAAGKGSEIKGQKKGEKITPQENIDFQQFMETPQNWHSHPWDHYDRQDIK